MSKTKDLLLSVVASATAITATDVSTGVNIAGLDLGEKAYGAEFGVSIVAGTADASNNFSLQLEVSDTVGGTYHAVGNPVVPLASGAFVIAFSSEQLADLISPASFFRVTATKTGTTNTGITYGCSLVKI